MANGIVSKIKLLYEIERDVKDLSAEEVVAARRVRSLPILAEIKN